MKFFTTIIVVLTTYIVSATPPLLSKDIVQNYKIKSATELFQRYDENGIIIPSNHKSFIELYNTNGTLKKRITFRPNNTLKQTQLFHYNRKGLRDGTIVKNSASEIIDKHTSKYNSNGVIQEEIGIIKGNQYNISYTYDNKKRLIKRIKKDDDENIVNSKVLTYNMIGKVNTILFESSNKYLTIFEYNTQGQKITETFLKDSIVNYTLEFTYTQDGKVLTEGKYDEIGRLIYDMSFAYTDKEKVSIIEQQYGQVMGGYYKKWYYYYNQDNNVDKIKVYDIDDTSPVMITKYLYKKIK